MAEGARLESVYTGNRIVGSNPTPSATYPQETSDFARDFLQTRPATHPLPIRSANLARRERIPAGVAKVAPGRNARRARLERRLENLSLH